MQRNHYEVLGLTPAATSDDIKKKYRELARKFHPDLVKDKSLGTKVFTQVNQAYHVLGDTDRRAEYDLTMEAERRERAAAERASSFGPASSRSSGESAYASAPSSVTNAKPSSASTAAPRPQPATLSRATEVLRLLGDAENALMQGDAGNAVTHCQNALNIDPRNVKALGLLGDALAQLGKKDEAAAAYRRALQIASNPILQAKLNRLSPSPASPPSAAVAPPSVGQSQKAVAPAPEKKGSLFGRILKKK